MNYNGNLTEQIVNNEFDYSNTIANEQSVLLLAKYIDDIYKRMLAIFEEDERKNEKLKWEFKDYAYKKSYVRLEFTMKNKNYGSIECETYEALVNYAKAGNINNLISFEIKMTLDYSRGKGDSLIKIENLFNVIIKPYEITFTRKSNYDEVYMKQIEDGINSILKQFKIENTIFCSK